MSAFYTSSSAFAASVACPHFLPANQRTVSNTHTHTRTVIIYLNSNLIIYLFIRFNYEMSCLSLSLFLALLLRLQLVIKFLLEFLFREVHFTNGSVVLYSPLSSCTVGQSLVLNKSL